MHYNPAMPIKNIIPGQTVTKEKLQRAKELRRDMTPAEKVLWKELRGNKRVSKVVGSRSPLREKHSLETVVCEVACC